MLQFGSLGILRFEQYAPEGNIKTASDALWYVIVTISTVGYGDRFPTTNAGRLLGSLIIVVGVGIFGTFTGYLANLFLSPRRSEPDRRGRLRGIHGIDDRPDTPRRTIVSPARRDARKRAPVIDEVGKDLRAPRAAGVAGLLFAILFIGVLVFVRAPAAAPGETLSQWYGSGAARTRIVLMGLYAIPLAGIAFLWFIGAVRARIGSARRPALRDGVPGQRAAVRGHAVRCRGDRQRDGAPTRHARDRR